MRLFVTGLLALILSSGCLISQHVEASFGEDLSYAACIGDGAKVVKLLQSGADVNYPDDFGNTPLICAAQGGHTEIVSKLLKNGAKVNHANIQYGDTALMWAARRGYTEIVSKLLHRGADVNHANKLGNTSLIWALQEGHTKIASMLLQNGAKVNHANIHYGDTPLIWAARKGHTEIVSKLLQSGADVNHANIQYGDTALMWAAGHGYREIVSKLLQSGADVNHANNFWITPLIWAAKEGHTEIVSKLLQSGADVGERAIDKACQKVCKDKRYINLLYLLKKHEKKQTKKLVKAFDILPPEMRVEIMNYMQGSDVIDQLAKSMKSRITAEQMMLIYLFKKDARPAIKKLKDEKPNAMQLDFIGLPVELQEAILKRYDAELYNRLKKRQLTVS